MDIGNLDLSEAAWLCLGKLAMAVELDCGRRFAFRKAVAEIVGLLEVAEASVDAEIRRKKDEFLLALTPGVKRLLGGGGGVASRGEAGPAERYYRGARVDDGGGTAAVQREGGDEPATPAPADTAVDGQGRKRIVYRGKVIYV